MKRSLIPEFQNADRNRWLFGSYALFLHKAGFNPQACRVIITAASRETEARERYEGKR